MHPVISPVSVKHASAKDRDLLGELYRDYVSTMSHLNATITDGQAFDVTEALNKYWTEAEHHPLLICHRHHVAGFALVRKYPEDHSHYDMDQFYVAPRFKRCGLGRQAFQGIAGQFSGQWIIRVLKENRPALAFWRTVVDELTKGAYRATLELDRDLEMHFIRFKTPAKNN